MRHPAPPLYLEIGGENAVSYAHTSLRAPTVGVSSVPTLEVAVLGSAPGAPWVERAREWSLVAAFPPQA